MRLNTLTTALAAFTLAAFATSPALADDMDDLWEDDDQAETDEEDDEEYQNSLYDSPTYGWHNEQLQVTYDAEGAPGRTLNVLAYVSEAPGERPVVLVSHGGGNGVTNPANVQKQWALYFADHGYNVIAIAHRGRTNAEKQALCDFFQAPAGQCGGTLAWDRPQDVEAVLDLVDAKAATDWAGIVDTSRIAVMGHSAGATGALIVGGATRTFGQQVLDNPDERVSAIIASSAAGIRAGNGLDADSWSTVDVPVLILTGSRDVTEPGQAESFRTDAFHGLPDIEKNYMLFLTSEGATHTLFGLNARKCRINVGDEECREMADIMLSTSLAHLDSNLLDDNTAKDWLEDEVVDEVATPGLADLTTREDVELEEDDD
jgi:pimeloyl-ACP methyl ester carboxylesterase